MQKGIMLKKCQKNKAYTICSSFVSFLQCYGYLLQACFPIYFHLLLRVFTSALVHLFYSSISLLFYSSVSFPERHTPRLRRVSSAPCGASNSGTDFFLAGFHPSTPSLPDALKVIATAYSFPRYGRRIVAAA